MAESPAHRFGQLLGEALESALAPVLRQFAAKYGLYLDQKGERQARRGLKCTWRDAEGNAYDLDFVLERGGTATEVGIPVAFIESAWRRYTKHSRNKVKEIKGAVESLSRTYHLVRPFKGVILAGVFTRSAIAELESLGFGVVYIDYDSIVDACKRFGIDARFDEQTADADFAGRVREFAQLSPAHRKKLGAALLNRHREQMGTFLSALERSVLRQPSEFVIVFLHGTPGVCPTADAAIEFVRAYPDLIDNAPIMRIEVQVRYSNGDSVVGCYGDRELALEFLRGFTASAPGG